MSKSNRVQLIVGLSLFFCLAICPTIVFGRQEADLSRYRALKEEAEQLYEQQSYTLASIKFDAMAKFSLTPEEEAEVKFRQYDAQWRALASVWQKDDSLIVIVRNALEALASQILTTNKKNELWALIEESLGDSFLFSQQYRDWAKAWEHYEKALTFWAGSTILEKARDRYLSIVFKVMGTQGAHSTYDVEYWRNWLPIPVIEDALKIARNPEERSKIHYLMAMTLKNQDDNQDAYLRVKDEFEKCLSIGNTVEWYDDALFHYAHWVQEYGKSYFNEEGEWGMRPNYEKALTLYELFLKEFPKGTSIYRQRVEDNIKAITAVKLELEVDSFFLPGSEIEFLLRWRNVQKVNLDVYPIDLTEDVSFDPNNASEWYNAVDLAKYKSVWSKEEQCALEAPYTEQVQDVVLPHKLGQGAYIIEASAGDVRARSFLLITEAMLVAKVTPNKILTYFSDGENGEPIAYAKVSLLGYSADGTDYGTLKGKTDASGVCVFSFNRGEAPSDFFVAANSGVTQAFVRSSREVLEDASMLIVYPYTDRPVYYLKDSVRWKAIVRRYRDGNYTTPLGTTLRYAIFDPQGHKFSEAETNLNEYGCAWGSFKLLQDMPLGTYSIQFWDDQQQLWLNKKPFFTLEERRLPEFRVTIDTLNEKRSAEKSFHAGDLVTVNIHADYSSDGPAKDTDVEVVVSRRPFSIIPDAAKDLGWESRYGSIQKVELKKLKTDVRGNATFGLQIPGYLKRDYEYTIEARLAEDDHYESLEIKDIRVIRAPYLVVLNTQKRLYSPKDPIEVKIQALDPYGNPKKVAATVSLERQAWREVRIDHKGNKIGGKDFHRLKRSDPTRAQDYTLQSEGYESKLIKEVDIHTNEHGKALLTLSVPREGFYRIKWRSDDAFATPVEADTSFWVADKNALDINVHDHLAIITNKSTVSIGDKIPILVVFPDPNQHAWVSFQTDDVLDWQVVGSGGWAAFTQLEVPPTTYPNITLEALLVSDFNINFVKKELYVPPLEKKLTVEITPKKTVLEPGKDTTFKVKVTDQQGTPVQAEVSLGIVDTTFLHSKISSGSDNPWVSFYNQKRPLSIQLISTTDQGLYKALNGSLLGKAQGRDILNMYEVLNLNTKHREEVLDPSQNVLRARGDIPAVYWAAALRTDESGEVSVKVPFPEGLVNWRVQARAVSADNRFGRGKAYIETRLPMMARLKAPQFFVHGDRAILSGIFTNKKEKTIDLDVSLDAQGLNILGYKRGTEGTLQEAPLNFKLNPGESIKTSWEVAVTQSGKAQLSLKAKSDLETIIVKKSYPVFEHGAKRGTTFAGELQEDIFSLPLELPLERRKDSTTLKVQVTPSLALALYDALPYLIEHTDKSTETVLNRLLAMGCITQAVKETGIFEGNKTFEEHLELLRITRAKGMRWLDEHQRTDGGWSWREESQSDFFITAYCLWTMVLLERSGMNVEPNILARARAFLEKNLNETGDVLSKTWMLHSLVLQDKAGAKRRPSRSYAKHFSILWRNRDKLQEEGLALLALTANALGFDEEARLIVQELKRKAPVLIIDETGESPTKTLSKSLLWGEDFKDSRWAQGSVVATSLVLMALLEIEPDSEFIKPAVSGLMQNRHGARWSHAQNTTFALLALGTYLQKHPELEEDIDCTVLINGHIIQEGKTYPAAAEQGGSLLRVAPNLLNEEEENIFEIIKPEGSGPLYYMTSATYFTAEDLMKASGEGISLKRRYYRIRLVPTLLRGYEEERELIEDGSILQVGDRVEVVLIVEGERDYKYVVIKDFRPSGFELLEQKHAFTTYAKEQSAFIGPLLPSEKLRGREKFLSGRELKIWQEPRLSQVAFFMNKLPKGIWEVRYQLRAENPGYFHALPAQAAAMYAPAIRANSDEIRFKVVDPSANIVH